MDKINLKEVTFTIPVRIDSQDRLDNLNLITSYISYHFDTNILIGEESFEPTLKPIENTTYFHYPSDNHLMHRTKVLNNLAKEAKTNIIVNYDVDVLFTVEKYIEAMNLIKEGYDFVYPYNGVFLNVPRSFYNTLNETKDINSIINNNFNPLSTASVGGCVFWNKESFLKGGGENENFISWGYEDNERLIRFSKLGFKHTRLEGPLYHIDHVRSVNSDAYHGNFNINEEEFKKVNDMDEQELKDYIRCFFQ